MNSLKILTIVLLLSFALFCKGASLGMLGHQFTAHHHMGHTADCCAEDIAGDPMASHHDIIIGLADLGMIGVFLLVLGVLFTRIRVYGNTTSGTIQRLYASRGSPILFSYLHQFTTRGLLHPKTW